MINVKITISWRSILLEAFKIEVQFTRNFLNTSNLYSREATTQKHQHELHTFIPFPRRTLASKKFWLTSPHILRNSSPCLPLTVHRSLRDTFENHNQIYLPLAVVSNWLNDWKYWIVECCATVGARREWCVVSRVSNLDKQIRAYLKQPDQLQIHLLIFVCTCIS